MKRAKVVATIGPATSETDTLVRLIEAGADVVRINASHGSPEEHEALIRNVREAERRTGRHIGIMLDIAGPKIRTGPVVGGSVHLASGSLIILTTRAVEGDAEMISVDYPKLPETVSVGGTIFLADGLIELKVENIHSTDVLCRVVAGGELGSRKGVSLPGCKVDLPAVTEKDVESIRLGVRCGVDFIAASFVRKARDVMKVREVIEACCSEGTCSTSLAQASGQDAVGLCGNGPEVIAKVESSEAIGNIDEIIEAADGVMVARGDLGIETPPEKVPLLQKLIISKCNVAGKPVITATEMLDSMVRNPRPTRAEVTDVANAILDGTDAVMLSAETAVGRYPVETVRMMGRIAESTEEAMNSGEFPLPARAAVRGGVADAISHATCQAARDLGLVAILTPTQTGATARMVAKYRPRAPILALTPNLDVARKLALVWGITPAVVPQTDNFDSMLDVAVATGVRLGFAAPGDMVAITAGVRTGVPGSTNLLKIHRVE